MTTRWLTAQLPASLSSRLLALFLLTAIAAVLLMASLFSKGLGTQWQRAIVPHLFQYVRYIEADLGSPPDEARARALTQRLPIQIQVQDASSGAMIFTTRNRPIETTGLNFRTPKHRRPKGPADSRGSHPPPPFLQQTPDADSISVAEDRRRPVVRVQNADYEMFIAFARPRNRDTGAFEQLLAISGLALLLALCYFIIRQLLKPIGVLQDTVQKISDGDLSARANARGKDDLAALAQSVDQMSERIQQMLDAKRELLLAISHELRSPLTRARIATEMLETSKHRQKIISDIDEMESLISRLVESERLQSHVVLDKSLCNISQLIKETVNSFDDDIRIHDVSSPVNAVVDRTRLQVLLRNLLENALQHGQPQDQAAGIVEVHLTVINKELRIDVSDNGAGIDEAHLASVTEPFYRTDASRTRRTGGMGLGLYLCQRIAQAHGGSLVVNSAPKPETGLCVSITLPLALPPDLPPDLPAS